MVVLLERVAVDQLGLGEDLLLEVVGAEPAQRVDGAGEERGAVEGEVGGPLLHRLPGLLDQLLQAGRVGHGGLPGPGDGDRLQVLGAEDRADPPAPRHSLPVLPVVGETGVAHPVLPGRADRQRVGVRALRRLDRLHGLPRGPPPHGPGVAERRAGLVDGEVDRVRRPAGDQHGVEAGALEGRREAAPEGRVEEEPGQRRLGGDAGAAVPRHQGVGDRADAERDRVRRVVRVDARRHRVPEEARGQAVPAEDRARGRRVEWPDLARARAQVHVKDALAVAVHGLHYRCRPRGCQGAGAQFPVHPAHSSFHHRMTSSRRNPTPIRGVPRSRPLAGFLLGPSVAPGLTAGW